MLLALLWNCLYFTGRACIEGVFLWRTHSTHLPFYKIYKRCNAFPARLLALMSLPLRVQCFFLSLFYVSHCSPDSGITTVNDLFRRIYNWYGPFISLGKYKYCHPLFTFYLLSLVCLICFFFISVSYINSPNFLQKTGCLILIYQSIHFLLYIIFLLDFSQCSFSSILSPQSLNAKLLY